MMFKPAISLTILNNINMTNKIAKKTIFLTLVTGLLLLLLFLPKPLLADAPSTSTEPTVPYDFRVYPHQLHALFILAFASAPGLKPLTSLVRSNS